MTRPPGWRVSCGQVNFIAKNGPLTMRSIRWSQSASRYLAMGFIACAPAFKTRMSSRPCRSTARSTIWRLPPAVATSAIRQPSPCTSTGTTTAPAWRSARTVAVPRPPAAPVTIATRPPSGPPAPPPARAPAAPRARSATPPPPSPPAYPARARWHHGSRGHLMPAATQPPRNPHDPRHPPTTAATCADTANTANHRHSAPDTSPSMRGLLSYLTDRHTFAATPGAAGGRIARRVQAAGKVRRPAAPAPAARPRSPGLGGLAVGEPGRPELYQPPAVQPAVEFVAAVQVADPAVEDQVAPGGVGNERQRVGHRAALGAGVAQVAPVDHAERAPGRRHPLHGQVRREEPADLRVADDLAVQHHGRDDRAVRADQCLREVGPWCLPQQQSAVQHAAAARAGRIDGPELRPALPAGAALAAGVRVDGPAPLPEHRQFAEVAGPGQAGDAEEVVPPGERPAVPDALRAGVGVDHDNLVGLLRAGGYMAGVVVGPDRDPRAIGRRRQGVRRPAGAQRAAGHPREPREVPGRGEPEPVDLLLPHPPLERGDVERPVPPGGQRGGDRRPGVPDRRHRDGRDDLAGGRRADHDLRDGQVGRDVERQGRGGQTVPPAGLAGSE